MAMSILDTIPQTSTTQNEPSWMAIDTAGQKLYVGYNYNPPPSNTNRVDKYDLATFTLETTMSTSGYRQVYPLSYDPANNKLYTVVLKMADFHAYVWKIDCATMTFTEFDLSVGVQTFLFPPNDSPVLAYDVDNQAAIYDTSAARYYMFLAGSSSSPADVCRVVVFNPASMSITGMAVIGTPLIPAGTGVYPRGVDIDYVNNKVWLGAYHITGEVSRYSLPSFALDGGFTAGEQINSVLVDPTNGFGYATDDPYAPPPTVAITIYKFDLSTMSLVDSLAEPFTAPFSLNLYIQSALGAGPSSGYAFFPISPDWTSLADQPRIQKIDLATFTESDVLLLGSPHAPNTDDLYTPYIVLDTANNVGYVAAGSMDGNLTPDLYKIGLGEPPPPEPGFGYGHNFAFHRLHNTGPTNNAIPHDTPLNQYTTTQGIGLRRKWVAAAALAGPFPPNPYPNPLQIPCAVDLDLIYDFNKVFKTELFVNGNNFTFVAPYGVTEVLLQIQGNGQGGAQGGDDFGGCGGLGGQCNYYLVSVIPGQSYPVVIDNTGIDWNSGEVFVAGDTSPQPGPTCDLGPMGEDGGPPECPGSGGAGGQGGQDYGEPGLDGSLGGGGGGGGAGAVGGYGGEGWVRVFYVNSFGSSQNSNHYPNSTHQTHQTGQTNFSIPHCVPLNQQTTTKGISVRNKRYNGAALDTSSPVIPWPSPPCGQNSNTFVANENSISTNWTAPPGVFSVRVQCQGPGENGDGGATSIVEGWPGGQGGGAGGYAESIVPVIPGNTYTITVGSGGSGTDTNFDFTVIGGTGGPGTIGGTGNIGDITFNGGDGFPGVGWFPPLSFSTGGNGGDSPTGGFGGNGGQGDSSVGAGGANGGLGAGGGGGGGGADVGGPGGLGGSGWMIISWPISYGLNHNNHQTHTTGQTNHSIQHCMPLNDYTTTKGVSTRSKPLQAAALSSPPSPPPLPPFCGRISKFTLFGGNTTTFTVPPDITSIYVECIGGGGDGDAGGLVIGGNGGGGGGYGAALIACLPGDTFSMTAGGPGAASTFGTGPDVQGDGGSTPTGGAVNIGDYTASGQDGLSGIAPDGGDGGAAPGGNLGGAGGGLNTAGSVGGYPGGGGGGGGASEAAGGIGSPGEIRVYWISTYGYLGDIHQTHSTGQTNYSIMHCTPLNDYTTTKGIGMRRKWFIPAEVPPPTPPTPFTAPLYTKYTYYAASLAAGASIPPVPPTPPFCGRQVQATFTETTSWVVPAGVTEIYVECVSGGGGGGDGGAGNNGGGGGGGAAYAASLLNVVPATTYPIQIGIGGTGEGVDGTTTDFNSGQVVADFGVGATGSIAGTGGLAANSVGDTTFDGIDGSNGTTGSVPPIGGGPGGSAPGGGIGGAGGAPNTAGSPGGYPGAGAGGGGSTFGVGGGAAGADGSMKITWPSTYGLRGDIHQTHSTGQTNYSIMHCTPLNQYTTTKGIGMRRKYILDVNPSDLRVTQEYAEVFNVDPPNPEEEGTQFYFEVMDQPPPQAGWVAPLYRAYTIIAAALAEPNPPPPPPEPFTAQEYLWWVGIGAALAASLEPEPTPPSPPCNCTCVTTCNVCARSGACPPPTVTYGSWSGTSP